MITLKREALTAGLLAAAMLTLAIPGVAAAQQRAFDLPAQPAVTAIPEFARQAGVQIVAPADELKQVRTPALRGKMEVRTALERLIAGAGLEIAAERDGAIILRAMAHPAPPSAALLHPIVRPMEMPASPPASTTEVDTLVVIGAGQPRQVQRVNGRELSLMAPGASPLELAAKLPSVNFESADAFGANEWSTRISVRNFAQSRLGFTLDDVPLGDMTFGNHNGLNIARAISGENLDSVELSQGVGSLEAASSSNLGGTLKFLSRDPSTEAGASAVAAVGVDHTLHNVLRLESGALSGGLRGYASYAYNTTDKWQGPGRQYANQVNLKAVQPISDGTLTGFVDLSRRRESNPQDLSLDMIRRLGEGWDNLEGDWATAVRLAEIGANRGDTGVTPHNPEAGVTYPGAITRATDAYYDATTARDDALTALTLKFPAGGGLNVKATVYGHWGRGQDLWWTPFVASPNYGVAGAAADNAPLSIQSTEYDIRRRGVLAAASQVLGAHTISAGAWLEDNDFDQARRFYGLNLAAPQRDYSDFQTGAFRTDWAYDFFTRTRQLYVQDLWTVNEATTVTAGLKSLSVTNRATTRTGPGEDGTIRAENNFLPRLGLRYQADPIDEVFANYGRGMRAFPASATTGPFAGAPAAFAGLTSDLKPEISDSLEVGWRRHVSNITLLSAIYGVKFHNRPFSTPVGGGLPGDPQVLANVGSVTAYGVETELTWRFSDDWSAFGSYAFNHAAYDDDVFDHTGLLIGKTAGKLAVDAPLNLAKVQLDYEHDGVFAHLGLSFLGQRYFTYENDQKVPAQLTADLAAGYRFSGTPLAEGLEIQVNVSNLFNAHYISTIGSNDFPIRGDAQTLLAGPHRQVFVTLRKTF